MRITHLKTPKKIGTILDNKLLVRAKEMAKSHHTTLNRLFEEALGEYLNRHSSSHPKPSNVEASFGIFPLSIDVVKTIEKEDIYNAE